MNKAPLSCKRGLQDAATLFRTLSSELVNLRQGCYCNSEVLGCPISIKIEWPGSHGNTRTGVKRQGRKGGVADAGYHKCSGFFERLAGDVSGPADDKKPI